MDKQTELLESLYNSDKGTINNNILDTCDMSIFNREPIDFSKGAHIDPFLESMVNDEYVAYTDQNGNSYEEVQRICDIWIDVLSNDESRYGSIIQSVKNLKATDSKENYGHG